MKWSLFFTISLLFCCCVNGQVVSVNIDSLNVLAINNKSLINYNWMKCSVNNTDTIIVLVDKNLICDNNSNYSLTKVFSIDDEVSFRLYENNIYIDDRLLFSKDTDVFLLTCKSP